MPVIVHTHRLPRFIRHPLIVLCMVLILTGCGGKSSPPSQTEAALVNQLVSQIHLEQSQRAELERQLEFNRQLQYVETAALAVLGGSLSVCLVVLYKRRNTNAP